MWERDIYGWLQRPKALEQEVLVISGWAANALKQRTTWPAPSFLFWKYICEWTQIAYNDLFSYWAYMRSCVCCYECGFCLILVVLFSILEQLWSSCLLKHSDFNQTFMTWPRFFFLCFWDKVCLCSFCLGTCNIDQAGHELKSHRPLFLCLLGAGD